MLTDTTLPRQDLYAAPHKGLRHFMTDTMVRLGMLDPEDGAAAGEVISQLRGLLRQMAHHQTIEDRFVLPAIEARRPGASAGNASDHHHHVRTMAALGDRTTAVERAIEAASPDRYVLAHRLYLEVSAFVGENLTHMAVEETQLNPLLWTLYDDDELRAIQAQILAWETPEQMTVGVRWIVPAVNPAERAQLVTGARAMLVPAVFDQLMGYARTLITQADWAKLASALDPQ